MNTDPQPSLATLLYPNVTDGRVTEEGDNNELLDYFHHDYVATEGDATASTTIPASANEINGAPHAPGPAEGVLPLPGTSSSMHGRLAYSRPTSTQREGRSYPPEGASPSTGAAARRSPSPPNPAVPIPRSLAQLASRVIPDIDLPDLSAADLARAYAQEQALTYADYGQRGEMGGKRRKQPHERAGWKEMDQQPPPGKKRRGRKPDQTNIDGSATGAAAAALTGTTHLANELLFQSASPQPGTGAPATADMSSLTELSQMALQGAGPSDGAQQFSGLNKPSIEDPTSAAVQAENEKDEDVSKLSRAEQNKRAQQAFRRRREEHMKKLEMDSAQLEIIKRQLTDKDATLRDLLLTVESSKIENAALQTVIKRLVPLCRASPLSVEGQLVVDEDHQVRAGVLPAPNDLDEAFALLGKQSRELAKQDRKRRQEE